MLCKMNGTFFFCAFQTRAFLMLIMVVLSNRIHAGVSLDCTSTSIGVENKYIIPDSSLTASSYALPFGLPSHGRLGFTYGWAAKTDTDPNDYLQVDLGLAYVICAVGIQGSDSSHAWVTEYKIRLSLDNITWRTYQENGVEKIFKGNINQDAVVKHSITKTKARYTRFYPTKYSVRKTMRVGIFGYRKECDSKTIGVESRYIIPDSSMTSSSNFKKANKPSDARFVPSNGRLSTKYGWAPKTNANPNDYLQIDLGLPYVICAMATQGWDREWTVTYKINISLNNKDWKTYQEDGKDKLFHGNSEDKLILQNSINKQFARYIRFIPILYHFYKTIKVGVFGYKGACGNFPLGMARESGVIQSDKITASSAQDKAKNARLNYISGSSWCASTNDSNPYLQIDLGTPYVICAVATQGNSITDQWVKTYQINTSSDGTTWTTYQMNNTDMILYGNYDRTTVVRQVLHQSTVGRYLRIVPKTYQTTPCLRTEIYGYKISSSSSSSVGIPSPSLVPDYRFTATSIFDQNHLPHKGRLGAPSGWTPKTTWSHDYLQIDIGEMFYICAVATQGTSTQYGYVKSYKVMYSQNNIQWTTYKDNGQEKNFQGNVDINGVVKNRIKNPFRAKFVRVVPIAFQGYKCIRVDLKGIPAGCTSSLGLENSHILDPHMTSSSSLESSHSASQGRLYGHSSWCSSTTSNTEYIQVDLGQVKTVTGIATQGDNFLDKWVTSYKIAYSFDNRSWNEHTEENVVKVFQGNTNRKDVIVNWLALPKAARYVRVFPLSSHNGPCLRFDLYGCDYSLSPKASVDKQSLVFSSPNSSKTITCSVLGEPTPGIQWFSNGIKINGATQPTLQVKFTSADDQLTKYNCTRQGPNTRAMVCNMFYTCRATYPDYVPSGGMHEASVKVTVNSNVPQAPTISTVPFQRSIHLSWTLPNPSDMDGPIISYVIEFKNQSTLKTISVNYHASSFNLTNLHPYTNYTVRMSAVGVGGQGLWSQLLHIRTTIAEPDSIPSITSLTPLTSQSMRVDWQSHENKDINGPMAGFRITYAEKGGPSTSIDVFGQDRTHNLTSLEKNTIYKVTVSVRNSLYVGKPSLEVMAKTMEDAPECAPVLKSVQSISSNSVLLLWSSLQNLKCTNGVLRGYKVVYKPTNMKSDPSEVYTVNHPEAKTALITGLTKSIGYSFQVLAFTVKDGPLSNLVVGRGSGKMMILVDKMTSLVKAKLNEKVILSCYATGAPPIRYNWTKDGAPIKRTSIKVIGNTVVVQPRSLMDYGTYLCTASNGKATSSYEIKLVPSKTCQKGDKPIQHHLGKLAILSYKMMPSINVAIGNKVTIGCYVTGSPPITYKWTKNGDPISSPTVTAIDNILFLQPKSEADYGRYLCSASNDNETVSFGTSVRPLKTCFWGKTKGNLTILKDKMMSLVTVAIGNKAAIGCYATGASPIRYNWTKNGAPIRRSAVKVIDNVLFVQPKDEMDYGKYTCHASSENVAVSYVIDVKPLTNYPRIIEGKEGKLKISSEKMSPLVRASYGDKVSLGCYATGAAPMKYSWAKDNSTLSSEGTEVLGNVLVIHPKTPADYGMYVCSVSNGRESATYSINLVSMAGYTENVKSGNKTTYYLAFIIVLVILIIICIFITVLFCRQRRQSYTPKELGIAMTDILRDHSVNQETSFLLDTPVVNSTPTNSKSKA